MHEHDIPKTLGYSHTIRRPNLRITKTEAAEIDTKGINNLFDEVIARHFINPGEEIDAQTQEVF